MEGNTMDDVQGLHLVTDDTFAQAYDAVDASLRARLKTNIALHHSMFGVTPSWQMNHTKRATDGFTMTECRRPVSWVVIALAESFASGPRLLAALMPSLLAGVDDVQVVRLADAGGTDGAGGASHAGGDAQGSPWPHPLLAALELAGQEQAASGNVEAVVDLVQGKKGQGCVLFLGADGAAKTKSRIVHVLAKMPHVTLWAEGHAPRLYVPSEETFDKAEADFDIDLIRWAHPDAVFCDAQVTLGEEKAAVGGIMPDAVYVVDEALISDAQAPLSLYKGCEALWLYPNLRPEFFTQRTVKIGLFE